MEQERTLINKILQGNLRAFQGLIEKYQNLVTHIVFRLISNFNDREDVCHEVFIKVYQNLKNFKFQSKLSTWIGRIAYNTAINHMRKERIPLYDDIKPNYDKDTDNEFISAPLNSVQTEYPNPDEVIEKKDRTELIQKQMEKLSAPYRTILTLYHLDQLSYQEIGEIMNLPEGTVKSYLFRGRKKLKENLVGELEGEEI